MSPNHDVNGGPYRASLIKRRKERPVAAPPQELQQASISKERDLDRRLRREKRDRIEAERIAIARIKAMTSAWNDELSSTVPSLAAVVSRAVAAIVGEAPREDVVMAALKREVARVRGDHRPVLRVASADQREWIDRLVERGERGDTPFAVRRDDQLSAGKCILELGARRVDLTPETQLAAFDDHLRGGVGGVEAPSPPPLPDVELDDAPMAERSVAPLTKADAPRAKAGGSATKPEPAPAPSGNARVTLSRRARTAPKSDVPSPLPAERRRAASTTESVRPTPSAQSRDLEPIDFESLDLGKDAARFETKDEAPAPGEPARATSQSVRSFRERMAKDVSSLRAMVTPRSDDDAVLNQRADAHAGADVKVDGSANKGGEEAASARWASVVRAPDADRSPDAKQSASDERSLGGGGSFHGSDGEQGSEPSGAKRVSRGAALRASIAAPSVASNDKKVGERSPESERLPKAERLPEAEQAPKNERTERDRPRRSAAIRDVLTTTGGGTNRGERASGEASAPQGRLHPALDPTPTAEPSVLANANTDTRTGADATNAPEPRRRSLNLPPWMVELADEKPS